MTLPILETARLRLRPRTAADFDACFRMDREPGTLDWVDWPEATGSWEDETAHRVFIRARIAVAYPPGMGYWVIARHQQPSEFLGWVLLIPVDPHEAEVEIGWRLITAARGQGFATEASRRVLDHGLEELDLDRVIADIHPGNAASVGVAQKIGMRRSGPAPGDSRLIRFEARAGAP